LSRDWIEEMHKSGLCRFGSHSHRHEILTCLSDEELGCEINLSREILEELLGVGVEHFCYPTGNADQRVRLACRNAGFSYGFTTRPGKVDGKTDPMDIPRVLVGGYDSTSWLIWKLANILCKSSKDKDRLHE
jgi:peptidoglycan/xylan/chitin deacetylase (PgdA/CDA1 family)